MKPSRRKIKAAIQLDTKQGARYTMGFQDLDKAQAAALNFQLAMRKADPEQVIALSSRETQIGTGKWKDGETMTFVCDEISVPGISVRVGQLASVILHDWAENMPPDGWRSWHENEPGYDPDDDDDSSEAWKR